jgi:fucose 4-O-acetylase-like acetyltransferase
MGGVMPAEMLWFVVVLIWDRLILNVFIRFKLLNYYTLGLFSICAFVFLIYIPFNLFFLKSVVLSFPFYFAGFFLKAKIAPPTQVCMNIHGGNRLFMYIFAIVLMGILFIGTQLNGMIYINASEYGSSLILFYLDGIIGCLGMLLICKSITISSSIVENISRSTLFLLCFHFWLVRYIRGILEHNDLIYPLYILISITVSAILILLGSFLYRRTYPYLKVFYGKG